MRAALVLTMFTLGFRHGVDWDHIAAITDITGAERVRRRAFGQAAMYIIGHALVVLVLGLLAILAGDHIPAGLDAAMGRVVGATLVVLGAWVVVSLVRQGRDFTMRSRWLLVADAARALRRRWSTARGAEVVIVEHDHPHVHDGGHDHGHDHAPHDHGVLVGDGAGGAAVVQQRVATVHGHRHRHVGRLPADPAPATSRTTTALVGALHGVGAETPTQLAVFLAAADAGRAAGIVLLAVFIAGLAVSNLAIAVAAILGFAGSRRRFGLYAGVAVTTSAFSLVVGTLLLTGHHQVLPSILGG
ncbi:MAG: hypothetical protein JWM05_180 [Acidimicrobiales bacterium]|nr:hypothetical protein [Acidimicrobiales bacterium]